MNFIPDAPKAAREMHRVTKSSGVVATTMWDGSRANELTESLWAAAIPLDATAKEIADGRGHYGSAAALSDLWNGAGMTDVEVSELAMECQFSSFDDYWLRLTKAQGPSGAYLKGLSAVGRDALRERLRENLIGTRPDGPLTLQAKAWAVRGVVP